MRLYLCYCSLDFKIVAKQAEACVWMPRQDKSIQDVHLKCKGEDVKFIGYNEYMSRQLKSFETNTILISFY